MVYLANNNQHQDLVFHLGCGLNLSYKNEMAMSLRNLTRTTTPSGIARILPSHYTIFRHLTFEHFPLRFFLCQSKV